MTISPPAFSILSLADLEMKSVLIVNFSLNSPVPRTLSLTNLFLIIFYSILCNTFKTFSNKKLLLSKGRTELDLVRSGLEDMMFEAYDNMSEIWNENDYPSLRTTAYIYSIKKLIESYKSIGI